jgi:thioredoxin-like negative regulator of GroEL
MTTNDSTHDGEVLLVADGGRAAGRIDALLREAGLAVRPIDPWDEAGTAVHLGVTSLPTALLVRDGEIVTRLTSTRQRAVERFFAAVRASSGDDDAPSHGPRLERASAYLRHLTTAGHLPDLAGA